jgi:transposase-like protein
VDEHLARFTEHMREGLLAASTAVGLEVMAELMQAEVTELAGPKGRHDPERPATRHGNDAGTITLGGRRVPVRRPRRPARARGALGVLHHVHGDRPAHRRHVARMLAGISTRRYPVALEPVGEQVEQDASGVSKSAVSRRFVAATAERLAELLARPLDTQRWLIVFVDGFTLADHTMVAALGVTGDGTKVIRPGLSGGS